MQLRKFGGIERFVTTLAEMFHDDYDVTIVANYGKESDTLAFEMPKNIRINYLLPILPKEVSLKAIIRDKHFTKIPAELKRRINIYASREKAFKTVLKNIDADYIITERSIYNRLVGKYYRGNARLIATDHNFHQYQRKYIHDLIDSIKKFDYLVVPTKELVEFYQTRTKVKCLFIPVPLNNIPTKKVNFAEKNVISIGRFYPEKDFLTLIDVMKKVKEKDSTIKLFLVGDGPQRKEIEKKIRLHNLSDNVVLTGALTQNQIAKYYYKSSVFVMTSLTEAFGLVITEAMSYGLPAIAFDRASGARAQISSDVGVLIKQADVEQMAEKIVELLNNPTRLKEYQININQKITQYGQEMVRQDWAKIIR